MSYDYNALVSQITTSRRAASESSTTEEKVPHLQKAVDAFSELSSHCPMTPLLWMQYSYDTAELLTCVTQEEGSARETRLQMLELALSEFPGSAILHLHYLQLLREHHHSDQTATGTTKIEEALEAAKKNVGMGSHRSEGVLVAAIYNLAADFYAPTDRNQALKQFVERGQIPIKDVNQTLTEEVQQFCTKYKIPMKLQKWVHQELDEARRFEAKTYGSLVAFEDEVDAAMHREGILPRHQVNLVDLDWTKILQSDGKTCWMGYGGMQSANAFVQYAQACYRYRSRKVSGDDNDPQHAKEVEQARRAESAIKSLGTCVLERGIAECPTVEAIWLCYIRHLQFLLKEDQSLLLRLRSVIDRSIRNCPYSLRLYQQKLQLHVTLAESGVAILDPSELTKIVREAINSKFIVDRESCLELFMTVVQLFRRRILTILAKVPLGMTPTGEVSTLPFDEPEPLEQKDKNFTGQLDDDETQEVQDLCDDFRDIYDEIDEYLRQNHSSWSEGRARLWNDRSYTEATMISPLLSSYTEDEDPAVDITPFRTFTQLTTCYGKLTKVHQPSHPDSYMDYIITYQRQYPLHEMHGFISKLRRTRFLFQKALKSVGKPKQGAESLEVLPNRDYESALRNLCHHYLVFEYYMGSEKSLANATKAIQKKIGKLPASTHVSAVEPIQEEKGTRQGDGKSVPVIDESIDQDRILSTDTDSKNAKPATRKREIGNVDIEDLPATKKSKSEASDHEEDNTPPEKTGDIHKQPTEHKVKVGKLEYPAHPFTVRVTKLTLDTEDMDLVDIFRQKCGPIVHARIAREKHQHGKGKSKGWGLVQFEDRSSVEKALALSEIIGIHDRLVKIDRSHLPAVGLVPPGMHRVNPKGEGRSSKQNEKRKEQWGKKDEGSIRKQGESGTLSVGGGDTSKPKGAAPSPGSGVLAFRPRGVKQSRKTRISLDLASKTEQQEE